MSKACNLFYQPDPGFTRLYIFGAGGSGREVAWLCEQSWGDAVELVFVVDQEAYLSAPINDVEVRLLGDVVAGERDRFVVAVGDSALRRNAAANCEGIGLRPQRVIHPRAEISSRVEVGLGSLICAGCIVTTNVVLGDHVHVNLDCTISHDVRIGNYATLSPGVHVSGHVEIGAGAFIGTGANIINGKPGQPLIIGEGAVIAAGACVTKSVEPGALVAGVPAVWKR
jgi:sugar O-acyltransferase (sialic acid O-acetyltransferase NeuD family)